MIWLQQRAATVFAPTNDAFTNATFSTESEHLAPYHLVGAAIHKNKFPMSITSTKQIAAPLILTYRDPHYEEIDAVLLSSPHSHQNSKEREYFVNNAKILEEKPGFQSSSGLEQVLYVIDEVLEPFIPRGEGFAPTANDLLQKQIVYDSNVQTSDIFASQVRRWNQEGLYNRPGNNTFFIPLISDYDRSRLKSLDEAIVKAHVIPNRALFFRTIEPNTEYRTAAWEGDVQVGVSLPSPLRTSSLVNANQIQSRTYKAPPNHHIGLVRTRVVRANIPVRNGVVHLIEKPFMIVDVSTWDFLESNKDGQISQFSKMLYRSDKLISRVRNSGAQLTIFAPNNAAFEKLGRDKLDLIENNATYSEELAGLHLVERSVSSEDVRTGAMRELPSLDGKRNLYFQVAQASEDTQVLTVEGGGVNSTAIQADIGATNGVIHIVDKVLGIPFQTVFQKMKDDFDCSTSYLIGSHRNNFWNSKLDNNEKRFTFFVPSKAAWERMRVEMPSEYKQLTEGILPVHGERILERHLKVDNIAIPSEELKSGMVIKTVTGELAVESGPTPGEIFLVWEGIRAKITRPDVKTINGVIHVIDNVLMKKRDMMTSTAASIPVLSVMSLILVSLVSVVLH